MTPDLTAAREALAATEAPPLHVVTYAAFDAHGHDLSMGISTDNYDRADLYWCEDCHDRVAIEGVERIEWDQEPSKRVDAVHLRAALATVDELTRERESLRNELRNVIGACVVPATVQVAYADDMAAYVRACMDAVAADHAANVRGLEAAVDHAAERIAEVVAERDELRAALAKAVAAERAAVVAYLRSSCNDPGHDDRWCPTCDKMEDRANDIAAGRHPSSDNKEKTK